MKRRSGFQIMKRLIVELKPLAPIMLITITMGILGFLAAIAIASFGAIAIGAYIGDITFISFTGAMVVMAICALLRGFLRYGEQLSGHYIAFKILYILRDKIFTHLRKLAPAKLEGKEKGNLISLITSDIELLEVFYAHTIAPIAIAIGTNTIMAVILFLINPWFGVLSVIFYLIVGFVIPYASSALAKEAGVEYRNMFGISNNYILDSLRGLKEVLLFNQGEKRLAKINENSDRLNAKLDDIKKHEGIIRACTDVTIMIAILTFLFVGIHLMQNNVLNLGELIVAIVLLSSSFGPVVALSNLSNNLIHTFACAQRLFDILDEVPAVDEVEGEITLKTSEMSIENMDFNYGDRNEKLLNNINLDIRKGEKIAILGESGCGKSTLLKLMMRFWDVNNGSINIDNKNIKNVPTKTLRKTQTLVTQETFLFNDSIENNIKIGKIDATEEEVIEACKKASIHDFITTLPQGYKTNVGELGGNLSSGERQRLGIARAFLHDGDILILDEPTSNLDTLNEAEILKSLENHCKDKTVVMVSHRKSSAAICDKKIYVKNNTLSYN